MVSKTGTILDTICQHKKEEISRAKKTLPLPELQEKIKERSTYSRPSKSSGLRSFAESLSREALAIIAEIKFASPSEGVLWSPELTERQSGISAEEIARVYEANGASAISVLTDNKFFHGDLAFLDVVKKATSLPVLRKDFIIDPYQIYESKAAGADALLLIAAALSFEELQELYTLSRELGLDVLVETHTREELGAALKLDAGIIGINTRDLKTFQVNLSSFGALAKEIPQGTIIVAESGIKTRQDALTMQARGAHAILVGSVLMKANNIGAKLRELKGFL